MVCSKFTKMALPKFYLRSKGENCAIQIVFQVSRALRMRTATELKINSKDWNEKTGLPKSNNPTNKVLSNNLQKLSSFLQDEYLNDYAKGVSFSNDWLKNKIYLFFGQNKEIKEDDNLFLVYLKNYTELRKLDSKTKLSTDRKFDQLITKFSEYQKKKRNRKFFISEIDKRFLLDFRKFLIDDFKMMESSANRTLKNIKTVLLDARDEGKIINHQINKFSIESVPAVKVFLNFDEIKKIKETQIIGADLQHAKDWLIIGCYTGQRVSDLLRMTKDFIFTKTDNTGESYQFIELTQEKTKKEVTIPLHDEVLQILEKYNGNFPPTFGKKGDSKFVLFNRYIKKICELSGIDNIVKGRVFNDETKRNEIQETEKFNLTSSHICRRSFATNFYGDNRFTTAQLMAITGHKTESVFLSYIQKTSSDHAIQTAKTFREITKQNKEKII